MPKEKVEKVIKEKKPRVPRVPKVKVVKEKKPRVKKEKKILTEEEAREERIRKRLMKKAETGTKVGVDQCHLCGKRYRTKLCIYCDFCLEEIAKGRTKSYYQLTREEQLACDKRRWSYEEAKRKLGFSASW